MSLELNPSDRISLLREQKNLDSLIGKTDRAIAAAAAQRNRRLEHAVQVNLPALTRLHGDWLARLYPGFMTADREQTFAQHGKIFGLFNRATTKEKLAQMQAQFRAYLEQNDYCREEDDELRRLSIQKVNLTRELQDITRQLIVLNGNWTLPAERGVPTGKGRPARVSGAGQAVQYDDDYGGSGDDGLVNGLLVAAIVNSSQDDSTVVIDGPAPDAVTFTGSDASVMDAPSAACIDTTDQLGCFS